MFSKLLWIMFAASTIDHARSVRLIISTGTMKHTGGDSFVEQRMKIRIRDFRRHDIIDLFCIADFIIRMKEDEEVHVWETMLLKFNGMNHCDHSSKEPIMDFFQEGILLFLKNTCNNVGTVGSLLLSPLIIGTWRWRNFSQQLILYLWPVGIGSHGEEDVWLVKGTTNSHGILKKLIHLMFTPRKAGWENDSSAMFSKIDVVVPVTQCHIPQSRVYTRSQLFLMMSNPVDIALLHRGPSVNHKLLKEVPTPKQLRLGSRSGM
jgi:hypothetical protein